MPFNGSGVFQRVRNWVADATAGVKIRADFHDSEDDNLAAGLTNCITKDGQTTITQNIPFNNKRITGLADPVNAQDGVTKAYSDAKTGANLPASGGTMTGDIQIKKVTASLMLNSDNVAGSANSISGEKSDKMRWLLRPGNDAAETGANAGTDFDLHRYADDGSYLGQALNINRKTGVWNTYGQVIFNTHPLVASNAIYLADTAHFVQWDGTRYNFGGGNAPLGIGDPAAGGDAVTVNWFNAHVPTLGFTPVQQGGGTGMFNNKIYLGWDNSGLRLQIDNNDTFGYVLASGNSPIRLLLAGEQATVTPPAGVMYEPYPGGVITGWSWTNVGYPLIGALRMRYVQVRVPGGYATVGTA